LRRSRPRSSMNQARLGLHWLREPLRFAGRRRRVARPSPECVIEGGRPLVAQQPRDLRRHNAGVFQILERESRSSHRQRDKALAHAGRQPDRHRGGGGGFAAGCLPGAGRPREGRGDAGGVGDVANGHAGTTYGNLLFRWFLATDGFSPESTAMPVTRDSITSGALSASVRPLRVAKPYVAGVPTT